MTREQIIQNIKTRISTIESYRPDEYALNEGNLFELKDLLLMIEKDEPSLPSNLDEAAERYAWIEEEPLLDGERLSFCFNPRIDAFKIGAKWMAKQGETVEGYITDEIAYNGIAVILDNEGQFKPGDKVIVQIRKKEE